MKPIVAIVGRPNVGKSTLFNRLSGTRHAITSKVPGTTRDRTYIECFWRGKNFILVDTGGFQKDMEGSIEEGVQGQIQTALSEADIILFTTELNKNTDEEKETIKIIRKSQKPIILVANKIDNQKGLEGIDNLRELGLGEPVPVSGLHGRGSGDLLDRVIKEIKKIPEEEEEQEDVTKVAIVGRPNVGKSTLLNQIIGKERAITSEVPGTTRDTISEEIEINGEKVKMIDTAGIRRRGKIGTGIEKFSVLRSIRAIAGSDITVLLIDAVEGICRGDLHIAQFALMQTNGLILAVNKWDAAEEAGISQDYFLEHMRDKFSFVRWAPAVFISALSGKNVSRVLDMVLSIKKEREKKIPTKRINNFISDVIADNPPKAKGRLAPKIYYSSQTKINPPTFKFKVNKKDLIHFSYKRHLENRIREEFGFTGTSIKLIFEEKK